MHLARDPPGHGDDVRQCGPASETCIIVPGLPYQVPQLGSLNHRNVSPPPPPPPRGSGVQNQGVGRVGYPTPHLSPPHSFLKQPLPFPHPEDPGQRLREARRPTQDHTAGKEGFKSRPVRRSPRHHPSQDVLRTSAHDCLLCHFSSLLTSGKSLVPSETQFPHL